LAFRSIVGLLLAVPVIPVLVARIRAEEALLLSHFGAEYEAYRSRNLADDSGALLKGGRQPSPLR
jgi:protein-S-isoprenylcysteine O-methyltransferase Ste14